MPAECDVSIRPGWFWHEKENDRVKTPAELMTLYYESVGRGASFLLNVPPDRRGLIYEADAASLRSFGKALRATFQTDLAKGAKAKASNVRGNYGAFAAEHLTDGHRATYWATDDAVKTAEVTVELPRESRFNVVRLREHTPLGQRVRAFAVDAWREGKWSEIGNGTSIGICRLLRFDQPVTSARVRLRITEADACPALSEMGLFLEGA